MYWADQLIQNLDKSKKHRVDDQSTPSGHYHVGSLRAVATHGLVFESMKQAGFDVGFTYVYNDIDPMDGLPKYLDEKKYSKHMGKPLCNIPAPDGKSESFAAQYAHEFTEAINSLGFTPTIKYTSQMYKAGDFDALIKRLLDNAEKIRAIYKKVAKQDKPKNWYPFQVICPQCGKIGSSLVTDWDGRDVTYECKIDLVAWSKGCGHKGKISPFGGTGKLMWKVEWPASWVVLGVTVEGSGKDHMSSGGSHDIGEEIASNVFSYPPPFAFMSEFFLVGGSKMSSSKGIGFTAIEMFDILPAELVKFLIVRTPYKRAINFDLNANNMVPDLFDEYDRAAKQWFDSKSETDLGRMFEAAQIGEVPQEFRYLPRFRSVANIIQMPSVDVYTYFSKDKGSNLTDTEKKVLDERVEYARIWLKKFASEDELFQISREIPSRIAELDESQKKFLAQLADLLESAEFLDGDALQQAVYDLTKETNTNTKKAFQAIYIALLNKDHGPKVGWLILDELSKNKALIINRFRLA